MLPVIFLGDIFSLFDMEQLTPNTVTQLLHKLQGEQMNKTYFKDFKNDLKIFYHMNKMLVIILTVF
jgi:hypothetical protein